MMRTILPGLAFAAMAATAVAGPARLPDVQLDRISAGAAGIEVEATALAVGTDGTYASTETETSAYSTKYVDLARGSGSAVASGDLYEDTSVSTQLYGDGDLVVGQTYEAEVDNPLFSATLGGGVVVAISPPQ